MIFFTFEALRPIFSISGGLWPHRGRVGSDTFMASRTHLWPSRTPKNLPRPFGPQFLQHISKNFCRAGQFYNATLFFCRYEAITVLAQSDFTLILLNKHGLVGFSRTDCVRTRKWVGLVGFLRPDIIWILPKIHQNPCLLEIDFLG